MVRAHRSGFVRLPPSGTRSWLLWMLALVAGLGLASHDAVAHTSDAGATTILLDEYFGAPDYWVTGGPVDARHAYTVGWGFLLSDGGPARHPVFGCL